MQFLINIDVDDLEKGIAFYEKGLGLQFKRRLFGGTAAEMAGGSSALYLIEAACNSTAVPATGSRRDYARHWTPVHLDFVVEDVRAAAIRAASAGAKQEGEIQSFDWGLLATMSDPSATAFVCFNFRARATNMREATPVPPERACDSCRLRRRLSG